MMARVIFVGNLPFDVREREVEDIFAKYGKIIMVDVKKPLRPPVFAFVEFDDPRDAADACRGRDGYDFGGERIRVELAKGGARRGGRGGGYGGGYGGGISRRSKFRVLITGLPATCSWQDLKDYARKYGDVTYANVTRDRDDKQSGIIDFAYEDDMRHAVKKLDDTEFERGYYIRVREEGGSPRRRSRSRSPRRRSVSRSPRKRSPSRSMSRSRSPARSLSRSKSPIGRKYSRSPSRSPARSLSR